MSGARKRRERREALRRLQERQVRPTADDPLAELELLAERGRAAAQTVRTQAAGADPILADWYRAWPEARAAAQAVRTATPVWFDEIETDAPSLGEWPAPSVSRYLTPADLALLTGDLEHGLQIWADRRLDADDPDGPRIAELARAFALGEVEVQILHPARPRDVEGPAEPPEIVLRNLHRGQRYAIGVDHGTATGRIAQTPPSQAEWVWDRLARGPVEIGPVEIVDRDPLTMTTTIRLPDGTERRVTDVTFLQAREGIDGLYLRIRP